MKRIIKKILVFLGMTKAIPLADSDPGLTVGQKAAAARETLANPIFKTALSEIRQEVVVLWENCRLEENAKRDYLWTHLKVLGQIEGRLQKYLNDAAYQKYLDEQSR